MERFPSMVPSKISRALSSAIAAQIWRGIKCSSLGWQYRLPGADSQWISGAAFYKPFLKCIVLLISAGVSAELKGLHIMEGKSGADHQKILT